MGRKLTVIESDEVNVRKGIELTVVRDHSNRFTGQRTITVKPHDGVNHLGKAQFYRMPDFAPNEWVLIGVDTHSDTVILE